MWTISIFRLTQSVLKLIGCRPSQGELQQEIICFVNGVEILFSTEPWISLFQKKRLKMVGISLWQIWNFDTFSRRRRGWALAESRPVRSHAETAKWPRKVGSALPLKTCHFRCTFDFLIMQGRKGVGGRVRPWTWRSFWVLMEAQHTRHQEQQELWRWVVWCSLLVYCNGLLGA